MTTKRVVADDVIGQIATRQWEIMRRVREGALDPVVVLTALQGIVQNEVDRLPIERVDWNVSSRVYEVMVDEADDFVTLVRTSRHLWNYGNRDRSPFVLTGKPQKRGYRRRLRLAQLTGAVGCEVPVGVVRIYADLEGYELATSWELFAFMNQSSAMSIIRRGTEVHALGDYGRRDWCDDSGSSYARVCVMDDLSAGKWSFDTHHTERELQQLDRALVRAGHYILLRENKKKSKSECPPA